MNSIRCAHLYRVQMDQGTMDAMNPTRCAYLYRVQTAKVVGEIASGIRRRLAQSCIARTKERTQVDAMNPKRCAHLYRVQTGEGASG